MTLHNAITQEMVPFDGAAVRVDDLTKAFVTLLCQPLNHEGKVALLLVLNEFKTCTGVLAGIRETLDIYEYK
jgi:hypothetical protein